MPDGTDSGFHQAISQINGDAALEILDRIIGKGCIDQNYNVAFWYGKDITFMGGIDNGKVDRYDWNQEMIAAETDQLCRDCGKLYFIPCTSHGLNFSCIPGVYEAVDEEIEKMSKELF